MPKTEKRVVRSFQVEQDIAEVFPEFAHVGLELHRLVEGFQRLFMSSLLLQRGAEAREILCFGILPDGAGDPFNRMIVLVRIEAHQAHQMQRVGVASIDCERLLAAKLGVKIAAGAKMLKAGLVERRRGVGGATCLVCVGGAGRPVLAAAHGIL